jgi:hypothetical protein
MDKLETHIHLLIWRMFPVLVIGAAAVLALIRFDVRIGVTYQVATVAQVQPIGGKSAFNRVVLIEIDGKPRLLRMADWHIATKPGQLVCVEKNRFLLRRWTRYALQLPVYCPMLRHIKPNGQPNGLSSPAPGLNVGAP